MFIFPYAAHKQYFQWRHIMTSKNKCNHKVTLKCPCSLYIQLDESTARRQLKSPRSLSGRSIHLTYILSWKFKVKVMAKVILDDHIWALEFNRCLLFVSWQSDHFWLRYSKFYIWPWKIYVKVMVKVKPDGHIWALEFNLYVCFSFRKFEKISLLIQSGTKPNLVAKILATKIGYLWA